MLSYRHAFHAGNYADVVKHTVFHLVLESLLKKDKPFTVVDATAGAGVYRLDDERALLTGETEDGILTLLKHIENGVFDNAACARPYLSLCSRYAASGLYPGSPEIARVLMRPDDHLVLMELHTAEIDVLRENMSFKQMRSRDKTVNDAGYEWGAETVCTALAENVPEREKLTVCEESAENVMEREKLAVSAESDGRRQYPHCAVLHKNGLTGITGVLPPPVKRGVVLFDPSYETESDYTQTAAAVIEARKKWNTNITLVWYPILSHRAAQLALMKDAVIDQAKNASGLTGSAEPLRVLDVSLTVCEEGGERNMYGTGMLIINPPWTLENDVRSVLPVYATVFGGSRGRAQVLSL